MKMQFDMVHPAKPLHVTAPIPLLKVGPRAIPAKLPERLQEVCAKKGKYI